MYIVFEGIVGAGKSTQALRFAEYLEKNGKSVVRVREPGTTPISEDIRTLAQGKIWEDEDMHPITNAYLYAAARAQTLHTVVTPALRDGKTVISDRSFLSSLAYQWEAQGIGFDTVMSINSEAVKWVIPDVIFCMDIDIDTALSRIFDVEGDKWESNGRDFFEKIAEGYRKCADLEILRDRICFIDANGFPDEVFEKILLEYSKIVR